MAEIWKTSVKCGLYEISNMGRVRVKKTGDIRKLKFVDDKVLVNLHETGVKTHCVTVGREVLSTFVRPPSEKEKCFHLNLNARDNRVENLEWREFIGPNKKVERVAFNPVLAVDTITGEQTTYDSVERAAEAFGAKRVEIYDSMRGKRVSKLDGYTFSYVLPSVNEEDVRTVRMGDHVIQVTSEGYVRDDPSKSWRQGSVSDSGYYKVSFQFDKEGNDVKGSGKGHYVHHLVAEAFLGPRPDKLIVDHKDENKLNNYASNLQYITRSENQQKSFVDGKTTTWNDKPVDQYELDGTFVKTHVSISEAAREVVSTCGSSSITACCKNKRRQAGGFVWRYHGEDFEQEYKPRAKKPRTEPIKTKAVPVYAYDKKTLEFFKGWPSGSSASKETGIAAGSISNVLNGKAKQTGGYIFSYLDNEEAFREDRKKRGL